MTKAATDYVPFEAKRNPENFERRETMRAGKKVIARRYSTNLDKYLGAWKRQEDKGITPDQHSAGEKFSRDYQIATASVGVVKMDLDRVSGGHGEHGAASDAQDRILRAFRAMKHSGKIGGKVVQRVCGHDEGLGGIEKSFGWPRGYGIIRLREGLDDLIRHYTHKI